MANSIFRLYDIRGRFPKEINAEIAKNIGVVLGKYFKRGNLVLGFDVRKSSPALYAALKAGLKENKKISFLEAGLITTPMLYFLVNQHKAAGGIMVTASHNPKQWNGMKVVKKGAVPMGGKEVQSLFKK